LTSPSIPVRSLPSYFFMGAPAIRTTRSIRPWSSMLLGEGYASWIVDSFTPHGGYSCDGVPSTARALECLQPLTSFAKRPDVQGNNCRYGIFASWQHCSRYSGHHGGSARQRVAHTTQLRQRRK
jgi:hypothetical protein